MLATVFLAASCSKDEVEEPTLTLSETSTIKLLKAVSEKAITVTTNQKEWTALANVDWIELTQSANTLTIKATMNATNTKRKAEVMVMAGGLGKKLMVEQEASNATIVTFPDKLELDQWDGKYQFDVDANTKDWNVTSDADWVKVTAKQFKSEVVIEVTENVKREARVAKLTLTAGKTAKEFTITQSGIMYYIMPYLQFGASLGQLQAFETARRSEMVQNTGVIFGGPYTFNTKSPAFPTILYEFTAGKMGGITVTISKKEVVLEKEFDNMMTENKFKLVSSTDKEKLFQKEGETETIRALVNIADNGKILYTVIPKQPKPMPTFKEMPYGFKDFTATGTLKAVQDWEAKNNGKYEEADSAPDKGFYRFAAPAPWINRAYIFEDKPHLLQTINFFPEVSLCYFEVRGAYYLTKEFTALMKKEGFTEFLGMSSSGLFFYGRKDKSLEMALRVAKYTDVNGGKPCVEIRFHVPDAKSGNKIKEEVVREDSSNKRLSYKAIR